MHGEARQAKTIFDRAVEIQSATERDDFVRRECADDAELRAKVQGLLGAYEQAGSFLESPPTQVASVAQTARQATPSAPELRFLQPPTDPHSWRHLSCRPARHQAASDLLSRGGL